MSSALTGILRPSWRYEVAQQAVDDGRQLLPSQADRWTRQLADYLSLEQSRADSTRSAGWQESFPGLCEALAVRRDPQGDTAAWIEALSLARESDRFIADRTHVSASAVAWYRRSFFSLDSRLDDVHYVVHYAILPQGETGSGNPNALRRTAMKLVGYFCATETLESVFLAGYTNVKQKWIPAPELAAKLTAASELCSLASLLWSSDAPLSEQRMEQLVKRLQQVQVSPPPNNRIERITWRNLQSETGPRL